MMLTELERLKGHAEAGIIGEYELSKPKKPFDRGTEWIDGQNRAQRPLCHQYL